MCAILSACQSADLRYANFGVGTELGGAGRSEAADLEDLYLGTLCRRADLPIVRAGGQPLCASSALAPRAWASVVEAGLNDIDQRCDDYLAWLDNRRRWTNPILKQIGDVNTAVTTILTATSTALPSIAIVAAAFGLARNTFVNLNSRLLFEIDQTTIQTLVLRRQTEFRLALDRPALASRPSAVYALRQYLRICMPFTIETEINTTVTTYERGGARALDARAPLLSAEAIGRQLIDDPGRPLPRPFLGPRNPDPALVGAERQLTSATITQIQTRQCLKQSGRLDVTTRTAILARLVELGFRTDDRSSHLTQRDITAIRQPAFKRAC